MHTVSYCRSCGTELIQIMGRKRKWFCNDECRYRYWGTHQEEINHKVSYKIICAACGESFESYGKGRKYCDHQCYIAARFGKEIPPKPKKPTMEPIFFECNEDEPPEPVFDEPAMVYESDEPISMLPVRIAHENEKLKPKRVFLLAGPYKFQGKFDHFSSLIPMAAQKQLMDGDVFVYCNKQRTQLSVLQWQEDGFVLFFKRTEFERYPWPLSPEPKLIEISPMDLRLLLEIPCLLQRISGIPGE